MPKNGRDDAPAIDSRWWVDTGKAKDAPRSQDGERPQGSCRLFDVARDFDQERAQARLTDLHLAIFEEAQPPANEWRVLHTVANERFPASDIERMKRGLPLPAGARGVIVDSGRSARFILTGDPIGERILEFRLGEESSFDCWVRGEWVREEVFGSLEDALRKARPYLERFLESQLEPW